ncbi:MAG: immunity 53 family protein [Bradyrhizobium sp.]
MGNPVTDPLRCLQEWYSSHCDGGWEHQYGVSIKTLDNPGWHFRVELMDTELFSRAFDEKDDWYRCQIRNHIFEGFCGPRQLNEVIMVFLNWAEGEAKGAR